MANTAYIVPIYEPDREWKEWLLREIYTDRLELDGTYQTLTTRSSIGIPGITG